MSYSWSTITHDSEMERKKSETRKKKKCLSNIEQQVIHSGDVITIWAQNWKEKDVKMRHNSSAGLVTCIPTPAIPPDFFAQFPKTMYKASLLALASTCVQKHSGSIYSLWLSI